MAAPILYTANEPVSVPKLLESVQNALRSGRRDQALEHYQAWAETFCDDPLLHAVLFNLGTLLLEDSRYADAIAVFEKAIAREPNFPPLYINLGNAHERKGDAKSAVESWMKAANLVPQLTGSALTHKITALKQIARLFETARLEADAEDILLKSLELDSKQRDVIQHWIALRQAQCKWPSVAEVPGIEARDLWAGISPLSLAVESDDPIYQLANAYTYFWHDVAKCSIPNAPAKADTRETSRPIRVGYLSSDLREHAVGFLMSEVFELHDRRNVEVFAYYCGIKASDHVQARFKASCDHWIDVSSLSDDEAIAQIRADKIDILVDLNGYTKDARLRVVAARPAPIIVNWLGFPGTMGSPHHNYIIADPVIIPEEYDQYFSEKVVRLSCYQPNDRFRQVEPVRPTRAAAGLPEDKFVFCCFNSSQKFKREVFSDWMEILRQVPDGVLWLLSGHSQTNVALAARAEEAGISSERLIFAPRMPNTAHLARYALADLFLDTFPYGAHTTASDALWMGVPVLTRIGQSFAARVCSSLVTAAGLPELVCESRQQYTATAVRLAQDRQLLEGLRARLSLGRDHCALFDTPKLVRDLERLFQSMRMDYVSGKLPVPDLSHLDSIFHVAIGMKRADGFEFGADIVEDYRTRLQARGCHSAATRLSELPAPRSVYRMPTDPASDAMRFSRSDPSRAIERSAILTH